MLKANFLEVQKRLLIFLKQYY